MKIKVIINPVSGNKNITELKKLLRSKFKNHELVITETEKCLHAIELTKQAVEKKPDIIIAAGGDGTVIEVITGLVNSNIRLGIIPFGTGNLLANDVGIPLNISKAIDAIIEGYTYKIDLGKINDKYFAYLAGCGFDARIINETSREKKKRLGLLAYFIEGFILAFKTKHTIFKIKLDNGKVIKKRALTVLIANNGSKIGNIFSFEVKGSYSDGLLDIIVISPRTYLNYLPTLWEMITGHHIGKSKNIKYYQAKEIEITSKPSILVQADGDIIGNTPVNIKVIPKSIEIFIPKNSPNINF